MQRLICTEGGASKFWEGRVEGRRLLVRFGKLGSDGQTRDKQLGSPAAAAAELARLIAEKRRKGYVGATARSKAEASKPRAAASKPRAAASKPRAAAAPAPPVAKGTRAPSRGAGTPAMASLWSRLEAFVADTPRRLYLRPGATEKAIRAAEKTMSLTFPPDFRESLRVHDGQEPGDGDEVAFPWLWGHPRLASLDRIVAEWTDECRTFQTYQASDAPIEIDGGRMFHFLWHPRRIPIAGNPWWDQDNTYLDFLPGPRGVPGQLVAFGKGLVDGLWCGPSFGSAFALYVDAVVSRTWLWDQGCLASEAHLPRSKRRHSWARHAAKQLAAG